MGLKDTLEAAVPEEFDRAVPKKNRIAVMEFADELIEQGINTPEVLAKALKQAGLSSSPQLSGPPSRWWTALWHRLRPRIGRRSMPILNPLRNRGKVPGMIQLAPIDPNPQVNIVQAALQGVKPLVAEVFEATVQDPSVGPDVIADRFGITEAAVKNIVALVRTRIRIIGEARIVASLADANKSISSTPVRPTLETYDLTDEAVRKAQRRRDVQHRIWFALMALGIVVAYTIVLLFSTSVFWIPVVFVISGIVAWFIGSASGLRQLYKPILLCTPTFPGPSASRKPGLRKQFTSSCTPTFPGLIGTLFLGQLEC